MQITGEQMLKIFASYNVQIWPMQIIAYLLGLAGMVLALRKSAISSKFVSAILAFFWLWVAFMFWLPNARQGFLPGYVFAGMALIQGALFLVQILRPKLGFGYQANTATWLGLLFVVYALVGYPLVGMFVGHVYPRTLPFGLSPCPVTVFTFGLLLLTARKVPKALLVVPLIFTLAGILYVSLGIVEDIGMVISGVLGVWLIWRRDTKTVAIQPAGSTSPVSETGWSLDLSGKD